MQKIVSASIVLAALTAAEIELTAPKDGESFCKGSSIKIAWSLPQDSAPNVGRVELVSAFGTQVINGAVNYKDISEIQATMPQEIGEYTVQLVASDPTHAGHWVDAPPKLLKSLITVKECKPDDKNKDDKTKDGDSKNQNNKDGDKKGQSSDASALAVTFSVAALFAFLFI